MSLFTCLTSMTKDVVEVQTPNVELSNADLEARIEELQRDLQLSFFICKVLLFGTIALLHGEGEDRHSIIVCDLVLAAFWQTYL